MTAGSLRAIGHLKLLVGACGEAARHHVGACEVFAARGDFVAVDAGGAPYGAGEGAVALGVDAYGSFLGLPYEQVAEVYDFRPDDFGLAAGGGDAYGNHERVFGAFVCGEADVGAVGAVDEAVGAGGYGYGLRLAVSHLAFGGCQLKELAPVGILADGLHGPRLGSVGIRAALEHFAQARPCLAVVGRHEAAVFIVAVDGFAQAEGIEFGGGGEMEYHPEGLAGGEEKLLAQGDIVVVDPELVVDR